MIEPQDCKSISEVRAEIDELDRSLISIISRRQQYVHAAASFKQNEEQVHAHERQLSMLAARRHWAETAGIDPDLIEAIFRTMVEHFIKAEMTVFSENRWDEAVGKSPPTLTKGAGDEGSKSVGT